MKKVYFFSSLITCMLIALSVKSQLYWRTDGANFLLTNPVWGTTSAGPFTSAWIDNSNIFFTAATNAITNVTNTPVGNITLGAGTGVNWGNAGTFNTNGNIRTIDIGNGSVLTWNNQPVSTTAGTGFIKNGIGTWNIGSQANLFTGGFTLNSGTMVVSGDNALGGGTFNINGGTIQSSSTRTMGVSSIVIGGDFEHTGSGNATWGMAVSLGNATRSILNSTLSGSRRYTGVISGNAGAGITFNGAGLAQIYLGNILNSYSGPISINAGEVVFNDDGSFGNSNSVTIDGGRLSIGSIDALGVSTALTNATINSTRTIYVGSLPSTSISVLGSTGVTFLDGVIADKPLSTGTWAKQGSGRLTIGNVCTYSGDTYINNGTLRIRNGDNRLPVTTSIYMGQASNTNLGILDLNGHMQQIAGLNSITGINASINKNTITSAINATLTVSGKGKFGLGTTFNSGTIAGLIDLIKSGIDTLELADTNTYTGNTIVSGGVLRLSNTGGKTIIATSNVTINGGTLRVSANQTINNLAVTSGTLLIDTGVTLTITGSYTGGGTVTNNGTIIINAANNFPGTSSIVTAGFNNLTIGAAVNLDQSLIINGALVLNGAFAVGNYTLTLNGPAITGTPTNLNTTTSSSLVFGGTFTSVFIPTSVTLLGNLTINNSNGVSLNSILSVYNSVTLSSGTLAITAGNKLEFNGASLTATGGYVSGTSTSDLGVIGTTGGTINLPTSSNISLRNITLSGNRVLKMDGVHHIALSGSLTIATGSTYDNGGETQLINGGSGTISITGTFITRDIQGFFAASAAIPGIVPVLNAGCTIEYALTGNQAVQGSTVSYKNVRFSGSGIKLLASTTSPNGTVFITASAIVNTNGFNFGGAATALTMDGGRLIVTTTGTQPAMQGAYNLTAGVVEFKGASSETIRTQTYQNIEVTGAGVGNSAGNITLRDNGTFKVMPTGVFVINDNSIIGILPATNTQTVTVQSSGLFRSGNNQGFNGFTATLIDNSSVHSNITNIVLASGSTVEYSRNGDQPITNANGLAYQNLLLSGTTGIKTAPAGNLVVNGNLTKTGVATFAHNNGTVVINGTTAQSYTSSATVMSFYNIDLNNAVGFSTLSDMTIVAQLSFEDNAKLNLQTGYITLKSDATNTANVGIIPVTASISYQTNTGFIAERYIATGTSTGQHTKAWQFLAVPVNGGLTVNSTWQEGSVAPNDNFKSGYGTQISSNLTGATTLGFDVYSPGGPSMKTFNPAGTGSWDGIPNTTGYSLYNPKGYMIFVRGDRSVINFSGANSTALPTILRATGKLFAPVSNPPSTTTVLPGKYESVGNPYASAIDLTVFADNRTGDVQDIYYVWDPQLTIIGSGSSYGYGGYRTLTRNGAAYDVTPPGGIYGSSTNSIQSGQAFFVKSLSSGGTVGFSENCKVSNNALVTRINNIAMTQLRTNLYVSNSQGSVLIDGVLSNFDNNFSALLDKDDAFKFNQTGENIAIYTGDTTVTVECRPVININDTIHYKLSQLRQQTYYLEFIPQQWYLYGTTAYLQDKYLLTQTPLSLTDTSTVSFQTDNNFPLSYASDRFQLIFKSTLLPLSFEFNHASAVKNNNTASLNWNVSYDAEVKNYSIERSTNNGSSFTALKVIQPSTGQHVQYIYSSSIEDNNKGIIYYRIKATMNDGTTVYSNIMKVNDASESSPISVYPNPVKDNIIWLYFQQVENGTTNIKLINEAGAVVLNKSIEVNNLLMRINIPVLSKGQYELIVNNPSHKTVTLPILVQ
ncbi:MAG: autotransporter-associated beta strand repeat-containing protein [Ferruginibacter sp.]